jgi:hypothetical protein
MVHCASGIMEKLVSTLRDICVIKKKENYIACGET